MRHTAREYNLKLFDEFGISCHRYRELKEFCRQYDEKKAELHQLYTLSSVSPEVSVSGGEPGKPTENKALKAMNLKRDIELVDVCLKKTCGEDVGIIDFLKDNVTSGIGFEKLGIVPCSPKMFYKYRRKFFYLLDKEKG